MKKIQKTKNCEKNQENKIFVVNFFIWKDKYRVYKRARQISTNATISNFVFSHIASRVFPHTSIETHKVINYLHDKTQKTRSDLARDWLNARRRKNIFFSSRRYWLHCHDGQTEQQIVV